MSNYGRAEVQERHVFQLEAAVNSPTEPWDHLAEQPSGGGPAVRFRLSWLHLDDPGLIWRQGTALYWSGCVVPPPDPNVRGSWLLRWSSQPFSQPSSW